MERDIAFTRIVNCWIRSRLNVFVYATSQWPLSQLLEASDSIATPFFFISVLSVCCETEGFTCGINEVEAYGEDLAIHI